MSNCKNKMTGNTKIREQELGSNHGTKTPTMLRIRIHQWDETVRHSDIRDNVTGISQSACADHAFLILVSR